MRPSIRAILAAAALPVAAHAGTAPDPAAVLETYADIAHATYEDSLTSAKTLQSAIDAFLEAPGADTHAAAKDAWLAARVIYQQSEAYRFGNAIVDDWEGRVNAWPLDEGLIDYVDASYGDASEDNRLYVANVIANEKLEAGGKELDASVINAELLQSLHEVDEIEANVATGYHPIEFLLWGQDLNGTDAGAGARAWTDFKASDCTHGHCERRRAYLKAAADLLIADLEEMAAQWAADGAARKSVTGGSAEEGLSAILMGLGSLSYGELAGARIKLGLMLHDPEEEHDCFSDNTHNSHYYDVVGIRNVYTGRYARLDGSEVEGPAVADMVSAKDPQLHEEVHKQMEATLAALGAIKSKADSGDMAYDQMIGEGNESGNAMVQDAVDALVAQAQAFGRVASALGLGEMAFEGDDSLDNPEAVFN